MKRGSGITWNLQKQKVTRISWARTNTKIHTCICAFFGAVGSGAFQLHCFTIKWIWFQPENILLDDNFCVKLSDFGFATIVDGDEDLTGTYTQTASHFVRSKKRKCWKQRIFCSYFRRVSCVPCAEIQLHLPFAWSIHFHCDCKLWLNNIVLNADLALIKHRG